MGSLKSPDRLLRKSADRALVSAWPDGGDSEDMVVDDHARYRVLGDVANIPVVLPVGAPRFAPGTPGSQRHPETASTGAHRRSQSRSS